MKLQMKTINITVQEFADKLDEMERESFAHSWGYLEGAADALDVTMLEMLEMHGLSLDAPAKRARKAR